MEKITAILLKKHPVKKSKHGGNYIRTIWNDITNNQKVTLDVYPDHWASKRFMKYLTPQTMLSGLELITRNGKKYISGYSSTINFIKIVNDDNNS
tara:strand:+ start:1853 stop:2137 length:285 start_codon:yes stop_codon:yes gene_type:complete